MEYSRNSASILPYFFAKKKQGIHQAVSLSSKKPTANTLFERYKSKMTIFPKICRKNVVKSRNLRAKASEKAL